MWPFMPRYRVEVKTDTRYSGFMFYIWRGCSIVGSGYKYKSAIEAAVAGNQTRNDLREAWRISHQRGAKK